MRLVGVIAVLLLLGSNIPHVAIAQALAAVDSGFSWGPVLVIAAIGLAIAGLVLWHKRNPSKADEAIKEGLDKARQEASELAHKTIDAVNRLVRTNEAQAMVIASPPVQAAINAGTPVPAPAPAQTPQPAPQNAPQATNAPAPVSSPQPQPAAPIAAASPPNPQALGVAAMSSQVNWRNFTFQPGDTPEQQEFNRLQSVYGPGAAYFYIESNQAARTQLETRWGVASGSDDLKDFYRRLLNQFANEGNPMGLTAIEVKTLARQERAYLFSKLAGNP